MAGGAGLAYESGMALFGILFGIGVLAAGAVVYFFLWGLADGTVSSFNMHLWLAMLAAPAAVLWGGWALRARGRRGWANVLLLVLAVPALGAALIMLVLIVAPPNWQ